MKQRILCLLLASGLLLLPTTALGAEVVEEDDEVTIYHTNDTHGYLQEGEDVIGIAVLATLMKQDPQAILVDAGDATQGLPIASLTKGNDVIELMNLAGYDLMAAGNHEFDYGVENFLNNVRHANFPVLAANVYRDDNLLLEGVQQGQKGCHTVIERSGKRIGFFGLVTKQTATATNPAGIQGISFEDEVVSAQKEIQELEAQQVDAIIAVAHLGNGDAPCSAPALAEAMDGAYQGKLDAIIDGHSHTVENEVINDVLIAQTGYGLHAIGELTLNFQEDQLVTVKERLISSADVKEIKPDEQVRQKLQQINSSQDSIVKEKIGEAATTLWAGWIGDIAMTRIVETNYGDLASDAFVQAGKTMVQQTGTKEDQMMPVIAVENGGGIREAIANGTIRKGDLIATFPFANTLYMKKITPKILYEMMEVSGAFADGQDAETGMLLQTKISGGFLQIGGFQMVYDPDGEEGNKVVSIRLDGQNAPLDPKDDITALLLVSNNYIMNGGNDYTMLASLPKYGEAGGELETIQAYMESCSKDGVLRQYTTTANRIQYTGSIYQPKKYQATIRVVDKAGAVMRNQKLSYRVDGGERINTQTNSQGIVSLTVNDGGHGIRLSDNQKEVYVNNYTGLGVTVDQLREMPVLTYLNDGTDAWVYEQEEPKQEEQRQEKPSDNHKTPSHPNTGDQSNLWWTMILLIASGAAMKSIRLR